MAVALSARNVLGPRIRGEQSRVHFPGREISRLVELRWNEHYSCQLPVVGGELFLAGCVGVYSDRQVDVYGNMSASSSPWTGDDDLAHRGGVVVWDLDEEEGVPAESWLARFDRVQILEPVSCRSRSATDDVEVRVGVAIVHPTSPEVLAFAVNQPGNIPASAASPERTAREPGSASPITR